MEKYKIEKLIGSGSFADVFQALNKETGECVAIKKMKRPFYSWKECMKLREIESLRRLSHLNIVQLKEVIRENNQLMLVFEFMDLNLYQMMKDGKVNFNDQKIRNVIYQVLKGLQHMHKNGYFHRDMKPENLLMWKDTVKIADFGLAREIRSRPPYTEYVSTRWYRAPEIVLGARNYNSPIDIWAVGCIMAELYTGKALFPGSSTTDQIFKICAVLGRPSESVWEEGLRIAKLRGFQFPTTPTVSRLRKMLEGKASTEAIDLIVDMLLWDPVKRPTATKALDYPYFKTKLLPQKLKVSKDVRSSPAFYDFDQKDPSPTVKDSTKLLYNFDDEFSF